MYTEFYSLAKKPFSMTPDPAFLFMTQQHKEALAGLTYAILDRKGFLVLSGVAGSGKTTLLAWVLQEIPRARIQSSVILNPTLTPDEFLELAMLDFGIANIPVSKAQRLWVLQKFLLEGKQQGKVNVLIVDEAHKLKSELLEEIRLLGNFECADEKLLQIVLIGQRELDDVLNRPDLWQLKQRISVRLGIDPLSESDVERYIGRRWSVAGGKYPPPFTPDALDVVAKASQCIPRLINSICDNALIAAFAEESASVTAVHMESAAVDLGLMSKPVAVASPPPVPEVVVPPPPAPEVVVPPPVAAKTLPITMKTVERYAPKPHRESVLARWAAKLGLA